MASARKLKQMIVLCWIDNDGFELTGRYRDRLMHEPETRATLQAKSARWGVATPANLDGVQKHITKQTGNHLWMGYFILPESDSLMAIARSQAMDQYKTAMQAAVTKAKEAPGR